MLCCMLLTLLISQAFLSVRDRKITRFPAQLSNRMVIFSPSAVIKGKDLKFALDVNWWISNNFFIKKCFRQRCVLFVGFECSRKQAFSDLLQNK